jgi:hypothetical protein
MTPEERKLVADLFNRLASLEDAPRDPAAVDEINEGLEKAPNAVYALVQTVLVQDEALKRADARIRELEGGAEPQPQQETSFLGGLRDQILGRRDEARGSVPSVRPGGSAPGGISSAWRNTGSPGAAPMQPAAQAAPEPAHGGGSSFLGTAAAAAAGVVGGSLLMSGLRSMMGGGHAHAAYDSGGGRGGAPRGGGDGGELSRQAGLEDMGRAPRQAAYDDSSRANFAGGGDQGDDGYAEEGGGDDGDFDLGDDGGDFGGSSDD